MRLEEPRDAPQIRDLLEASFPGFGEAILVDRLRSDGDIVLSLVAEDEGVVIGYDRVLAADWSKAATRLSRPSRSRRSPSTRNISSRASPRGSSAKAHACLAALGETLSVVVGEPSYYGRFGYSNRRVAKFVSDYQSPYLMGLSFGAAPSEGRLGLRARLLRARRRCRATS